MMKALMAACVILFLGSTSVPAHSLGPCYKGDTWRISLAAQHNEEIVARMVHEDYMVLMYADPKDGSWTLVLQFPKVACFLMGANSGWQEVPLGRGATHE